MKKSFSLAKSRIGVYFNTGEYSYSVQVMKGQEADAKLIKAIKAAFDRFNEVYLDKEGKR